MSETSKYVEAQPCSNYTAGEDDAPHDCPDCGESGVRRFCVNCFRDHHKGGWQHCNWKMVEGLRAELAALKSQSAKPESEGDERERLRDALRELLGTCRASRGMEDDFRIAVKQADVALLPEAKEGE